MKTKKCACCGVVKPVTEFHKKKATKDGLQYICKDCNVKQRRDYYTQNKEKELIRQHDYYIQNKEKVLIRQHDYYIQNKEKELIRIKKYWATPRGRLVAKAIQARRRARKLGNTPSEKLLTNEQIETLYETTTHCPYCGVELSTVEIHLDHVYPLSKGGQHTLDNVVLCCAHCNMRKGAKEPIQWMLDNGIEFGFMTNAGYISAYEQE